MEGRRREGGGGGREEGGKEEEEGEEGREEGGKEEEEGEEGRDGDDEYSLSQECCVPVRGKVSVYICFSPPLLRACRGCALMLLLKTWLKRRRVSLKK